MSYITSTFIFFSFNSSPPTATQEQDLKTQRDLAILRGFLHLPDAVVVLESIQTAGLDDDEDPFTVRGVRERHALLCRSVRIATRLVGGMGSSREALWAMG